MIELLPDEVVDQIAAGEVVERPASVVKELVENALDAGAGQITVEIEGGGRELIRVSDDGCGMSAAEAELALRRHATSKLRRIDDLCGLSTFGFRGEALPSIASVSRMRVTTRARGALAAVRLEIEGGRILGRSEVGAPVGTRVEIRDLLFNVPARRKFLKGEATEAGHIADVMSKVALAHPAVHVRFVNRARTALSAPVHPDGFERARAVLGRVGQRLERGEGEIAGIRAVAYLGPPDAAQTTARGVQLFVGRRPVRDRGLLQAVVQGYGELLPRGRYPVAVIFVDVPDPDVDVNVHPQKLEVRFSDGQAVFAAVRHTVRQAVAAAGWAGEVPEAAAPAASAIAHDLERSRARSLFAWRRPTLAEARFPMAPPRVEEPLAPAREAARENARERFARAGGVVSARGVAAPDGGAVVQARWPARAGRDPAGLPEPPSARPETWRRAEAGVPRPLRDGATGSGPGRALAPDFFSSLRYLGQLDRTYLLCEADGELVVLDQHGADARAIVERLRTAEAPPPSERFLVAEPLPLEPAQLAVARRERELLETIGFELELGPDAAELRAAPAGLRAPVAEVAVEILGALAGAGDTAAAERRERALAVLAHHLACRPGDTLEPPAARAILGALDAAPPPHTDPRGQPILARLPVAEIARRLAR